jgi:hypothetical protein
MTAREDGHVLLQSRWWDSNWRLQGPSVIRLNLKKT